MPSAARLGDLIGHAPPIPPDARGRGGPGGVPTGLIIGPCSGNVFVNGIPAARSGVDLAVCSLHPPVPLPIATGSSNVFINGCPAVRLGDLIKCSAIVITGSGNVFIGGGGSGASGTVQTGVLIPELETEPVILQSLEASDAGAEGLELDESVPSMSYGEQMKKVGGFYGDLAIGAAKGILNLIPETAAFAYRMSGYAIAGVASHFDSDVSYTMFSKYEKVTGRIWQYENSVQAFGGIAAQLASPAVYRGATTVGVAIYSAEIGAVVAATRAPSNTARQVGAINLASSSAATSVGARGLSNHFGLHPHAWASLGGEVNMPSVMRALRQSDTTEGAAIAKLLKRGDLKVNFSDEILVNPQGGLMPYASNEMTIFRNYSGTPSQTAGLVAHEGEHFLQRLTPRQYADGPIALEKELAAYSVQRRVDSGFFLRTDREAIEYMVKSPLYPQIDQKAANVFLQSGAQYSKRLK